MVDSEALPHTGYLSNTSFVFGQYQDMKSEQYDFADPFFSASSSLRSQLVLLLFMFGLVWKYHFFVRGF